MGLLHKKFSFARKVFHLNRCIMTAVIKSEYKYGEWYENYWKRIIYRRGFASKNPVKICYIYAR